MDTTRQISQANTITGSELKSLLTSNKPLQFIDLRLPIDTEELPFSNVIRIPIFDIENAVDKLCFDSSIILVCKHGVDSFFAATLLQTRYKIKNVYSLKGGLANWTDTYASDF